ncbi:hypothetical protein HDU76_008885, partial [Blyttiomyces sp. JEL0837]
LGVWTIFTLPTVGYDFGLLGAFAYAFACIVPFPVLILMGNILLTRAPNGVTITEFVLNRFGWAAQVCCNLTSLGYMFVYLVSELTALGQLVNVYGVGQLGPTIAVCVATAIYTAIGGMPASLLTDKFQGWLVMALVLLAAIAFGTQIQIDRDSIPGSAPLQTSEVAWESWWVLTAAVTGANVFHQGYWQRVYSAKSKKDLFLASMFAVVLTFPVFLLIGFTGIIDVWRNVEGTSDVTPFFDITSTLPDWMNGVVLVLAIALVCSSVDTLQSAMSALIVNDIFQSKISLGWARVLTTVLNVPALVVASLNLSVLRLFLVADLIACAIVLPVVFGLFVKFDRFFNGLDFVVGTFGGMLSVVFFGAAFSHGDWGYAVSLLGLPNQISVAGESLGVFIAAPAGSVVFMVVCALIRRAVVKGMGGDPDFIDEANRRPKLWSASGIHLGVVGKVVDGAHGADKLKGGDDAENGGGDGGVDGTTSSGVVAGTSGTAAEDIVLGSEGFLIGKGGKEGVVAVA